MFNIKKNTFRFLEIIILCLFITSCSNFHGKFVEYKRSLKKPEVAPGIKHIRNTRGIGHINVIRSIQLIQRIMGIRCITAIFLKTIVFCWVLLILAPWKVFKNDIENLWANSIYFRCLRVENSMNSLGRKWLWTEVKLCMTTVSWSKLYDQ